MLTFEDFREYLAENMTIMNDNLAKATEESAFGEIGFDSLDVVGLVMMTEDLFKVDIPDDDLEGSTTLGQLYRLATSLAAPGQR